MTSNSASQLSGCDTVEKELFSVNTPNDEPGLSPTSKKILEKCSIPITPVALNRSSHITPTLISRPPSSDLDSGGFNFHFTKPKLPTPSFTSRLNTKHVRSPSTPSNYPGSSLNAPEAKSLDVNCTESSSR